MTIKDLRGYSTPEPGIECSEENCRRPAVTGFRRMEGEIRYTCQAHHELHL
jgi:hypothetical protein